MMKKNITEFLLSSKKYVLALFILLTIPYLSIAVEKNEIKSKNYNANNASINYSNAKLLINELYNKLEEKNKIVLSTNKFLCTGTNVSCAESTNYTNIGFINKDEYNKIGKNSYLTKYYDFWTMSEEGSNTYKITKNGSNLDTNTSLSGVRPTIYLNNAVEVTGKEYFKEPYLIKEEESKGLTLDWIRRFGGEYDDFYSVKAVSDGYIVVGGTFSNTVDLEGMNNGSNDAVIVKYTKDGTLSWKKTFGGTNWEEFFDVVQTSDGGYVAVGETSSNDKDVSGLNPTEVSSGVIVKYNASGTVVWKKVVIKYVFKGVIENKSGEIVVAGGLNAIPLTTTNQDAIISKYSSTGTLMWSTLYGRTTSYSAPAESFKKLIEVTSGGYVAVGNETPSNSLSDGSIALIAKYSENGTFEWKKIYENPGYGDQDYINDVVEIDDGYVVVGGSEYQLYSIGIDAYIVKLSTSGEFLYGQGYGGVETDEFKRVIKDSDGGFIIVGYSNSSDGNLAGLNKGNKDGIIVKMDKDFNLLWKKNFGGSAEDIFYFSSMLSGRIGVVGITLSTDGDFLGIPNKGSKDAVIYSFTYK